MDAAVASIDGAREAHIRALGHRQSHQRSIRPEDPPKWSQPPEEGFRYRRTNASGGSADSLHRQPLEGLPSVARLCRRAEG